MFDDGKMSIVMKIVLVLGGVLLIIGSSLLTLAALFPPKEYEGDGRKSAPGGGGESIEDV